MRSGNAVMLNFRTGLSCLRAKELVPWNRVLHVRVVGDGFKTDTEPSTPYPVKKPKHRRRLTNVMTLRPERFTREAQKISDLSGAVSPSLYIRGERTSHLHYCYKIKENHSVLRPFPPDTKGYLYFHHSPGKPALHGGVRFKLCNGLEEFQEGSDLLIPSGEVWDISVAEIISFSQQRPLLKFVRGEKLIGDDIVEDVRKNLHRWFRKKSPHCIYSLSDPFIIDVSVERGHTNILTRKKLVRVSFLPWFFVEYGRMNEGQRHFIFPFSGAVRLQYELSTLPEHRELGPTLVMRVLEIVKPITVDPKYNDGTVVIPEPGELLHLCRMSRGKKSIAHLPISRQAMNADILELAKEAWPTAKL
ncbi:hypothetical protein BDN70DRAFT_711145 [Pholiota conissans]|uniref:Uncharacterized protein n=1 Tax=Pholiota conissans TaxID=109636 RepID=A0A9P5Z2H5_9AGAR|nr:hypothetical protein BDN70DRAFT_711145 [Pholiota conissans]